jgi:hypothetical protein
MKRVQLVTGAVALVAVVVLAACTSSKSGRSSRSTTFENPGAKSAVGGAAAPAAAGAPAAGAPAERPGAASPPIVVTQALIRTADLTVEIAHGRSVTAPADRAERIAIAAGGLVYAEERSAGPHPAATLTLKVPGAVLRDVVDKLAGLGYEKSRDSSTQDVTGDVADVASRVQSAQTGIAQLRILLDRATKIGDLIALENELSQREADLEALEAKQRALDAQTSMATVTLHLTTAAAPTPVHHKHHDAGGFVGGLQDGWRAFAAAAGAVATGIGALLPFLALALVIGAATVVVRRRLRGGTPPVLPPADPA